MASNNSDVNNKNRSDNNNNNNIVVNSKCVCRLRARWLHCTAREIPIHLFSHPINIISERALRTTHSPETEREREAASERARGSKVHKGRRQRQQQRRRRRQVSERERERRKQHKGSVRKLLVPEDGPSVCVSVLLAESGPASKQPARQPARLARSQRREPTAPGSHLWAGSSVRCSLSFSRWLPG